MQPNQEITYREYTEQYAQSINQHDARYKLFLGFYRTIPAEMINARVPICRTLDNSNLFIPAASYREMLEISRMFPNHGFHVYAATSAHYSNDLGHLLNGQWTAWGGEYTTPLPSNLHTKVYYYNRFGI
jgi:hypothetical protein